MMDLAVVMPVYNEKDCIASTISSWLSVLSGIKFKLIVLNDGSKDGTDRVLEAFNNHPQIEIINKLNSGHGPTILQGYRLAVESALWVFQCDSDNEIPPEFFHKLWEKRREFDALFGVRTGRKQNLSRLIISACARFSVRLFFGKGISDVNIPYRLIRSDMLKKIISGIAADTFAPNVIISGMLVKCGARIYEYPVPYEGRKTGVTSIVKWKLWRSALRSFWQIVSSRRNSGNG